MSRKQTKTRRSVALSDVLPRTLPDLLNPFSRIGLGYDIATTTKAKSNPSSLTLLEEVGVNYIARLVLRWKTADPAVARAIITAVLMLIAPRRPVRLVIDASNEKYYATDLRKALRALVTCDLVSSGESITYLGETMSYKQYLGNLAINMLEAGHLWLPNEDWLSADWRLVNRSDGTFVTELGKNGEHGDTFDSTKLALHGLVSPSSGPAEAAAAQVGNYGTTGRAAIASQFKNPAARQLLKERNHVNV